MYLCVSVYICVYLCVCVCVCFCVSTCGSIPTDLYYIGNSVPICDFLAHEKSNVTHVQFSSTQIVSKCI